MRFLVLALALAAPASAVASTPTYSNPLTNRHYAQESEVMVTFVNHTPQEREVRIGNQQYRILPLTKFNAFVPVGSTVLEFSDENTKVNGQELMRVSANDAGTSVFLK